MQCYNGRPSMRACRHDDATLLGKLKAMPMIVERQLGDAITVPVYSTHTESLIGAKPKKDLVLPPGVCCIVFKVASLLFSPELSLQQGLGCGCFSSKYYLDLDDATSFGNIHYGCNIHGLHDMTSFNAAERQPLRGHPGILLSSVGPAS